MEGLSYSSFVLLLCAIVLLHLSLRMKFWSFFSVLQLLITIIEGSPPAAAPDSSDSRLEVYILPHSHCDPGWWYTFDDYHKRWVVGILDAILNTLSKHKHRHFIWAEVSYFKKWYDAKGEGEKAQMREIVKEGRLEFVTGGWVMHDEAVSHYRDDLLQLELGQAWLWSEFRVLPQSAWLIDPFGHSPTTPLYYNGMKGVILNRIHYEKREERKSQKELEFWWKPQWSEPKSGKAGKGSDMSRIETGYDDFKIFSHTLTNGYYDIPNTCGPDRDVCEQFDFENIAHAVHITKSNLAERAGILARQYRKQAKFFKTRHILIPLGDDFKYKTSSFTEEFLGSWDLLFDYINANPSQFQMRIRYSNLSTYFDAVKSQQGVPWSTYDGSFLEYSDKNEEYWSGFYTSRAVLKRWIRESQIALRFAEIVSVWREKKRKSSSLGKTRKVADEWDKMVLECQENQSLLQHHDAVTGTARKAVVQDYRERSSNCVHRINDAAIDILLENGILPDSFKGSKLETAPPRFASLIAADAGYELLPGRRFSRISMDADSESHVVIFNSLSYVRSELVEISVKSKSAFKVFDSNGHDIPCQLTQTISMKNGKLGDEFILSFWADLEALAFSKYRIQRDAQLNAKVIVPSVSKNDEEGRHEYEMDNGVLQLIFDFKGAMKEIRQYDSKCQENDYLKSCKSNRLSVKQTFAAYSSSRSGAYIFNPDSNEADALGLEIDFAVETKGPVYSEIYFKYKGGMGVEGQIFRLYKHLSHVHYYDHGVHANIRYSHPNHDVIVRYDANGDFGFQGAQSKVWTDANGWVQIANPVDGKRTRASQFRPVVSKFSIVSDSHRLDFITRSSLAVGNYEPGQWELVLDRQVANDDGRGLGERLDDNSAFTKEFRVVPTFYYSTEKGNSLSLVDGAKSVHLNRLTELYLFPPALTISSSGDKMDGLKLSVDPFNGAILPYGMSIHSIRKCLVEASGDICIQIEHDGSVSFPLTFHLAKDSGNDALSSASLPKVCKLYDSFYSTDESEETGTSDCSTVTLRPYEIKTIRVSAESLFKPPSPSTRKIPNRRTSNSKKEDIRKIGKPAVKQDDDLEIDMVGDEHVVQTDGKSSERWWLTAPFALALFLTLVLAIYYYRKEFVILIFDSNGKTQKRNKD